MDYRTITDGSSVQYQLQETARTDLYGFRRSDDERYMVALGTYYAGQEAGRRLTVVFDNGESINCVVGDIKADCHTDESNRFCEVGDELGCILEFIVDVDKLPEDVRISGDCSKVFPGEIVSIVKENF